jgi:Fe-S-cluster containining protein
MDQNENFHFARAQTKKFFKLSKPPTHCTTVLAELHKRLAMLSDVIVKERNVKLACQAGCSYCCHLRVDAYAHEVLFAADFIRRNLSTVEIDAIIAKSKAHAGKVRAMTLLQQMSSNNACPLLVDNRCSAYGGRPISCRSHHATNVNFCAQFFESCNPLTPSSQDSTLYEDTRAVWTGIAEAYAEEGYDSLVYDFGSAIGEALENPATARRWRDKKRAFSSEVLAKDPPTDETFAKLASSNVDAGNSLE